MCARVNQSVASFPPSGRSPKMLSLLMAMPRRALLSSALGALALGLEDPASATDALKVGGPPVMGDESIMAPKAHGTSASPVQQNLKWNVDVANADRITNYNRRFAEYAGYWKQTSFLQEVSRTEPTTYYDSVTGKPLFRAPIGRTMEEFLSESNVHGWPSFRDQEVVWDNTRVLRDGETVSITGTHLGHNLPVVAASRSHASGVVYHAVWLPCCCSHVAPTSCRACAGSQGQPILHQLNLVRDCRIELDLGIALSLLTACRTALPLLTSRVRSPVSAALLVARPEDQGSKTLMAP